MLYRNSYLCGLNKILYLKVFNCRCCVIELYAFSFFIYKYNVQALYNIRKCAGRVKPGLPPLALPAFSVQRGNSTDSFLDMAQRLGPTLVMLPAVMVIANIAIAKAYSQSHFRFINK
jgi:hypothetical protein